MRGIGCGTRRRSGPALVRAVAFPWTPSGWLAACGRGSALRRAAPVYLRPTERVRVAAPRTTPTRGPWRARAPDRKRPPSCSAPTTTSDSGDAGVGPERRAEERSAREDSRSPGGQESFGGTDRIARSRRREHAGPTGTRPGQSSSPRPERAWADPPGPTPPDRGRCAGAVAIGMGMVMRRIPTRSMTWSATWPAGGERAGAAPARRWSTP